MFARPLKTVRITVLLVSAIGTVVAGSGLAFCDESADLDQAIEHLQRGRYDEAIEAFSDVLKNGDAETKSRAIIGLSRALEGQGEYVAAIKLLRDAAEPSADVLAQTARLQFTTGRLEESAASCEAALKSDADQPLAHLILARLYTGFGELEKANQEYRWFVRFYNRKQPTDAETLLLIAEGAGEYARWNRVSSIFNFIINTLCVGRPEG